MLFFHILNTVTVHMNGKMIPEADFTFYMTTEQLLNGIYCIISHCLYTGDIIWLDKFPGLLSELVSSLENRDAPTAKKNEMGY